MSFRPLISRFGLCAATLAAACAGPGEPAGPDRDDDPPEVVSPAPEPEAQGPTLDALQQLAAEDPAAALHEMDSLREARAKDAAFWLLYARTSAALFRARQADGSLTPGLAADLLDDSAAAYGQALRLDPADADVFLELAANRREAGQPQAAWEAAAGALGALDRADLRAPEARIAAARYGVELVAAAVGAGEPVPAAAQVAERELLAAVEEGVQAACVPLSDLYAWQGETAQAIAPLARLLTADPTDAVAYARLANLGMSDRNLQVATLEQLRMDRPDSADALWYLGEARYLQGRETRAQADHLKAMECWDRAEECFLQAMNLEPSYADSCREWLHIVRTQRGWTLRDEGRISEAAETFAAALEADPARLEPASTPESLHLGIDAVTADFYRAGDLREARRFLRRVCAVYDRDPNWTNNLGFFCRELGTAAAARGEAERARQYYEESWEAYTACVEVSPDDPRLVNDRALIAVYYLDEHHDLAEQELHRVIALGAARMAEWTEDVPEEERLYVEEAVGDAWENLAYLELVRRDRIGEAPRFLEESVRYFPYEERDGVQALRARLAEMRNRDQ